MFKKLSKIFSDIEFALNNNPSAMLLARGYMNFMKNIVKLAVFASLLEYANLLVIQPMLANEFTRANALIAGLIVGLWQLSVWVLNWAYGLVSSGFTLIPTSFEPSRVIRRPNINATKHYTTMQKRHDANKTE